MQHINIAKTVHDCRKQSGLSQQALAKFAGVGKTVIFDIEKGKQSVKFDTLLKIFDILNIQLYLKTPFDKGT